MLEPTILPFNIIVISPMGVTVTSWSNVRFISVTSVLTSVAPFSGTVLINVGADNGGESSAELHDAIMATAAIQQA
jgi:hypothetical protein